MDDKKVSYYLRNREKILEKRRIQREQKRRLLLTKQMEELNLTAVIIEESPVADPVVVPVTEPVVAEFAERTEHKGIEPVIEPVMEPVVEQVIEKVIEVDEVKKPKRTKKPKTI